MRVRYIEPRRPQQNGKVERSHRIDDEEFWNRYAGRDFDAAMSDLAAWEYRYNHQLLDGTERPDAHGEASSDARPTGRHIVVCDERPVSEHALLNRQGGRAQRTSKRQDPRVGAGARS